MHVWLRSSEPVCLRSHKSPELSLCPRLLFVNKRRRLFGKVLLEGEYVFCVLVNSPRVFAEAEGEDGLELLRGLVDYSSQIDRWLWPSQCR